MQGYTQEKAVNIIIEELEKKGIKVIEIFLFGSRARGDFKSDSDWDFLVIVDKELSFQERRDILAQVYRNLTKLEDSYEIIVSSFSRFARMKNFVGCISYDADKEGVVVWKRH